MPAQLRSIDDYLQGVEHDTIVDFDGRSPRFLRVEGDDEAEPPGEQDAERTVRAMVSASPACPPQATLQLETISSNSSS